MTQTTKITLKDIAEKYGLDMDERYVISTIGPDDPEEYHGTGHDVCEDIFNAMGFCIKENGMGLEKALEYAEKEVVAYVTEEEWKANQP